MDAHRLLTFEGYSLDLANERLLHEGEVVALTPKAFAVLRRLVEDGGQLVTKKELLRAGWADTHVTDGVLRVSILEIRRTLGDDPAAPRFIETVSRRGYGFIPPRTRSARVAPAAPPRGAVVGRGQRVAQLGQGGQRRGRVGGQGGVRFGRCGHRGVSRAG